MVGMVAQELDPHDTAGQLDWRALGLLDEQALLARDEDRPAVEALVAVGVPAPVAFEIREWMPAGIAADLRWVSAADAEPRLGWLWQFLDAKSVGPDDDFRRAATEVILLLRHEELAKALIRRHERLRRRSWDEPRDLVLRGLLADELLDVGTAAESELAGEVVPAVDGWDDAALKLLVLVDERRVDLLVQYLQAPDRLLGFITGGREIDW